MVKWLKNWLRGPPGPPGPPGPMGPIGLSGKDLTHEIGWAIPTNIDGANLVLGPPANWDSEKYGECSSLPVIKHDGSYISEWKLPNGQRIRVHITGSFHPPIAIQTV